MTLSKSANRLIKKRDLIHLTILLAIALGIGTYHISTTVLIAQDGVYYVERAQKFSSNPIGIIKSDPFGYPFLIFVAHKLVTSFSDSSSVLTWIYSAQSVTLLCRLLALIPLYFIGKLLVGSNKSFQAIFILVILPYPARFGSDVLKDWPHILFLASGFLLLLWSAKRGKCWMFGAAGLAAGLGHLIRPECAQLVIYAILWILIRLFLPKHDMSRPALLCALVALLIGFAIPAAPYMTVRGNILPGKLKTSVSASHLWESEKNQEPKTDSGDNARTVSSMSAKIVKAIGRLIGEISDNLMYYFVPALLIGIYFHFYKQSAATEIEKFFIPALVALNVVMLTVLYCRWGYISRRHSLPLVVFTIFYVPIGLEGLAAWLTGRFSKCRPASNRNRQLWFSVLLIIGTAICLVELFRPIRADKRAYRTAAKWLRDNTAQEDLIAVPDKRISFYAERKGRIYNTKPPRQATYVVSIVKNKNEEPNFAGAAQEEFSVWVDKHKKTRKIVIYRMIL